MNTTSALVVGSDQSLQTYDQMYTPTKFIQLPLLNLGFSGALGSFRADCTYICDKYGLQISCS